MENTESQLMHRAVSVQFIKNSGGFAVKADRGHKEPRGKWDPKNNDKHKSDTVLLNIEHSSDNIGIHLHGDIVDVDVDGKNPYLSPALEAFLPPCSHVWGRESKPRSHRVYQLKSSASEFDPSEFPVLRRLARIRNQEGEAEVAVELRGGNKKRGEYSLLPGSVHPSGEHYEWDNPDKAKSSLTTTTPRKLVDALRLAGVVSVMAPYWQEGLRNDLVMALSGFLHRIHKISETLNGTVGEDDDEGGFFSIDENTALRVVNVICMVTDDDASDKQARVKTFKQTWKKAENGDKVTGATTIQDLTGDSKIVQKLYTLLSDSPDINTIQEFTERFVIWQGPGCVIDMDAIKRGSDKPTMRRMDFGNSFGHKFVRLGDKRYQATEMLYTLEATTRVAGLTFEPGDKEIVITRQGQKVNQWSGFEIKPWHEPVTDKEVEPFLTHLYKVVSNSDDDAYKWILHWVAHIFVAPARKSKTALTLVGKPGAGKSLLGHKIIKAIIGNTHAATTNTVESITKDFNVLFGMKIFIQCDEAINNKQRAMANRLKALVTDEEQKIEPKFVDGYFSPNHSRFLFTSNDEEDAMYLNDGLDDRRYTIQKVSDAYKDRIEDFWEPYIEWLDDPENLAKIHRYLRDVEIDWSLISRPLKTAAKVVMQQRSMNAFDKWLAAMLDRQHPLAPENHRYWFEAPILTGKGAKYTPYERGHQPINRSEWPEMVCLHALTMDYEKFIKSHYRGADILDASQIAVSLSSRGLMLTGNSKQVCVKYTNKEDRMVESRVRWKEFPSFDKIHAFLSQQYGLEYEQMIDLGGQPQEEEKF